MTSGLQKQLAEVQEENERLRRKAAELEGHLEFQVGTGVIRVCRMCHAQSCCVGCGAVLGSGARRQRLEFNGHCFRAAC